MKAAIITANYDGYDTPKPICEQADVGSVRWVYVTDGGPDEQDRAADLGWEVVYQPRPGSHPNRAAKYPKMFPLEYAPGVEFTVWLDSSYRVVDPMLVSDLARIADPIAQFVHPWRCCLYDEASASVDIPKYAGEPIAAQAVEYAAHGHPIDWGLWATGVIARWHRDPRVAQFGRLWSEQIEKWSFQDQVSHPYILRRLLLRPAPIPGTHLSNRWLAYEGSGRH